MVALTGIDFNRLNRRRPLRRTKKATESITAAGRSPASTITSTIIPRFSLLAPMTLLPRTPLDCQPAVQGSSAQARAASGTMTLRRHSLALFRLAKAAFVTAGAPSVSGRQPLPGTAAEYGRLLCQRWLP
jgi:hypothetical protein